MTTDDGVAPNVTISVLHNVSDDHFDGYKPGDLLVHVADMTVAPDDVDGLLEEVYTLCNIGSAESLDERVATYRRRRNRSLSTGDVLIYGEVAFAVTSVGFERVALHSEQVSRVYVTHGSRGIDAAETALASA